MDEVQILVVENEAIVSMDLRSKLEALGYSVPAEIRSGEEAVVAATQLRPNLVLMDIRLSGKMDGIDAAALILEQLDIPVVYITAYADDATLERATLTEPFGYLLKPMDTRTLKSVVEVTIHKHQIERRLKESEGWLSAVLKSTSDAVVTADREGKVNLINPAAEALLKSTSGQVLGKRLTELFTITGRASSQHPVTRALSENTAVPFTEEVYFVGSEANVMRISGSAAPIRDDGDNLTGVVLTIRDKNNERLKKFERNNRDSKRRFGEYLRSLRRQRGWTQTRAGEAIGVDGVTIRRWELGLFSPSSNRMVQVAEAYEVEVSTLLESAESQEQDDRTVEVPVIGHLIAGTHPHSDANKPDTMSLPSSIMEGRPSSYCLIVSGHSLVPDGIHNGDFLLVSPDQDPSIGALCVLDLESFYYAATYISQKNLHVRTATGSVIDMAITPGQMAGTVTWHMRQM